MLSPNQTTSLPACPFPSSRRGERVRGGKHWAKLSLAVSLLLALTIGPAVTGPNGATVVSGSATVQGQGTSSVVVNQTSQNAIINWQTFNIGAGQTTKILMPNSSSTELDRVTGGLGPSQILGSLYSNGKVFLVNPDGILFGAGSRINVGGLLATTNNISNSDFMSGHYNFNTPGNPTASVVNLGSITALTGGFAALVAPGVRNTGIITANLGTVALASGNTFTLDLYGDNLITLSVNDSIAATVRDVATGRPLRSLVSNTGTLKANGGIVVLTAAAARKVVDSVINNSGVIEANTIGTHNGRIVLGAATGANKPAGAPTQTVKVTGKLFAAGKAPGTTGGTIEVTGENIVVAGANIDASGQAGGGTVLIGGDTGGGKPSTLAASIPGAALGPYAVPTATTVSIDASSVVNASAIAQGNGGKVVVWSDQDTTVAGTISAKAGASGGNGGFVEMSGGAVDFTGARVNTSARAGKTGTWLVDPTDLIIDATAAATINTDLQTTNVTLQTNASGPPSGPTGTTGNINGSGNGDIIVDSTLSWTAATTLTLNSHNAIIIDAPITIGGAGGLSLTAAHNPLALAAPLISFGNGSSVQFSGTPNTGQSLTINGHAYTLLYSMSDVQNINSSSSNLSGYYALAVPLDATGVSWTSLGTDSSGTVVNSGNGFSGTFQGLGNTISNLTINSSATHVGLFGYIGTSGVVSNLGIKNSNISADLTIGVPETLYVGGLVADNLGTITNSYAAGSVSLSITGTSTADELAIAFVGGLAGANNGSIANSYATAAVSASIMGTLAPPSFIDVDAFIGGLVGSNSGSIIQSFATGPISSAGVDAVADTIAGALVGANSGSIANSYATGAVSITITNAGPTDDTGTDVGGLVGYNTGSITESYATGALTASVSGASGQTDLGGLVGVNGGNVSVSYWDKMNTGQTAGFGQNSGTFSATGLTTAQLQAALPSGFDPSVWAITAAVNSGYPCLLFQAGCGVTPAPSAQPTPIPPPMIPVLPPPQQQIANNPPSPTTAASPTNAPVVNPPASPAAPPAPAPAPASASTAAPQTSTEARVVDVPPPGETRYISDEVLVQVSCDTPQKVIDAIAQKMHLSIVASKCLERSHKKVLRMHINNGHKVADVIKELARFQVIAVVQPNYAYEAKPEAQTSQSQGGNAVQYAIAKLDLAAIHQLVTGKGIKIAVIDSKIDVKNPELEGDIAGEYDAVGVTEPPDTHGTEMAGVIAAHDRLTGIAPGAQIYAVHAFSRGGDTPDSTTFSIVNALDWAIGQDVRVINMSFTGPRDPSIDRALQAAHDKGIVLVAAAGNFGPESPPLYPGANPNVIAVTATDSNDMVFSGANHGNYIAVAAPGVDIAVPAPDGTYELTTGTSVAAAEVSGVVALMLERNPALTPDDVRLILTATARHPGTQERDDTYGWGLVDLTKAIQAAAEVKPPTTQ
jgi:filamentous hemagglutinin family protein